MGKKFYSVSHLGRVYVISPEGFVICEMKSQLGRQLKDARRIVRALNALEVRP